MAAATSDTKRVQNFTEKESVLLLSIVEKHKTILECKKSDTDANSKKKETWLKVADEFNSSSGETYRSVDVLKNKYANCKRAAKRRFANDMQYIAGTGGGPAKKPTVTDVDIIMKEIVGKQITGNSTEFGSDSVEEGNEEVVQYEPPIVSIVPEAVASTSSLDPQVVGMEENWTSYTPASLKTPKSQALRVEYPKRKDSITNKAFEWTVKKNEAQQKQKEHEEELHNIKKAHLLELHELSMEEARNRINHKKELYKREIEEQELKLLFMKEEHEVKMHLLQKKQQ